LTRYSYFLFLSLFISANALASGPSYTLFAVDLALGANEKATAFEIIRETTLNAPETNKVGLTLFDDTIRGFVAPASLEKQHIITLHQAMAEAPQAVRSTSNLTVGIERAIDALEPLGGANLVVFTRGVIDTQSDDPRAKFIEWLDEILLEQASTSNIAISLIVQKDQPSHETIKKVFAKKDVHRIIISSSTGRIAPELASLLNIAERTYGQGQASDNNAAEAVAVSQEPANNQDSQTLTDRASKPSVLTITRLALLFVLMTTLFGLVYWRSFARRSPKNADHTAHSSSTYLPLTQKPSETMDHYRNRETDLTESSDTRRKS